MNVFWCQSRCTCLFIVLANIVEMAMSSDRRRRNELPVNYFSGEFENFLHGLGSMVYKYKNPTGQTTNTQYFINEGPTTKEPTKVRKKNENFVRTEKEVLKDVLMMKLVSYYEDKYKVTHTQIPDTLMTTSSFPILSNIKSASNKRIKNLKTTSKTIIRRRNAVIGHLPSSEIAEVVVL